MKVAVGSDHRGYKAKELIKAIITQLGHECIDVGTIDGNPVDYPGPSLRKKPTEPFWLAVPVSE
jgi:ribose 5-phosphate isomerase RpiB